MSSSHKGPVKAGRCAVTSEVIHHLAFLTSSVNTWRCFAFININFAEGSGIAGYARAGIARQSVHAGRVVFAVISDAVIDVLTAIGSRVS